jgi:GTP pyrophosphokinase
MTTTTAVDPSVLIERVRTYLPEDRVDLVERAFYYAAEKHEGQLRKTGEPYIIHPLDAAITVASLKLDANAVAAALLHDVQEDCGVTPEELRGQFNAEVARLVDGATKLETVKLRSESKEGADSENLRKMFLAMAEDVRVVIIKLADRLHNMRTLDAMPLEHQRRKARETLEIYAPLANRLGIWQIKWELEDLAFRHLEPQKYKEIAALVASKRASRERYIAQVEQILSAELENQGIKAEVTGRAKHIYSIYQKMKKYADQGKSFNEIYDLLALRVLVESVGDCYNALGVVHSLWRPIPGQFDDYIANPNDSGYQSLHTTVLCLGARPLEVQIRTCEMHEIAEYGIAAHWQYKEGARGKKAQDSIAWMRQLLEWQREIGSSEEFVESVRRDLFQDQVFVYTPKGDVKDLPAGATPLDFAYRVHTDLGHRCIGAKVNGRLVPLNQALHNGDIVEIIASKQPRGPSRDWLNQNLGFVTTTHARQKIRQWFKREARQENQEKGKELVERELRRLGLSLSEWQDDLRRLFHVDSVEDLFASVGDGSIGTERIARVLAPLLEDDDKILEPPRATPVEPRITPSKVRVLGSGDLLTQIARCCAPVPGDPIVGFITRSRGVSIHHQDCANIRHSEETERMVDVAWGQETRAFPVSVRVEAQDRLGLLRDLAGVVAEAGININGAHTEEHQDGTISVFLTVETSGIEQLTRLMARMEQVKGVLSVTRNRLTGRRSA